MENKKNYKIIISKDGPYLVSGNLPLYKETHHTDNDGNPGTWEKGEKYLDKENYALCRCGKSSNKPFCDSRHISVKFKDSQ